VLLITRIFFKRLAAVLRSRELLSRSALFRTDSIGRGAWIAVAPAAPSPGSLAVSGGHLACGIWSSQTLKGTSMS
jgi:hypothetical protein